MGSGGLEAVETALKMTGSANLGRDLLLDLGIPVAIRCSDLVLGGILERELGGFATTSSPAPEPEVLVQAVPLDEEVIDGSLETDDGGWSLTTWGVRMRVDLGQPTRITMEVTTQASISVHLALQDALYLAAPHHGALLLHAAGLDLAGRAIVISGDKDAGKTTACRNAPHDARVLSDEGIICAPAPEGGLGWTAHSTPFHSDEFSFAPAPGGRPLGALVHLVRAAPSLKPLGPSEALWLLMRTSGRLGGPAGADLLALMARLVEEVPFYLMGSDAPEQVWQLLEELP